MSDIAELLETDENGSFPQNDSFPQNGSFPQKAQNSSLENSSDGILADGIPANDEVKDEIIAGFLPLTLVKDYCRIIGDAENELLKLLIASARAEFESYTQRNLGEFGTEIPANVIKWGLAVVADAFENRGVFKKDLFFALERYRRSPLRLDIDEKDKLKAQLLAQKNLINELMLNLEFSKKTELNSKNSKAENSAPAEPEPKENNDGAI